LTAIAFEPSITARTRPGDVPFVMITVTDGTGTGLDLFNWTIHP
jgi:hypothetical protein